MISLKHCYAGLLVTVILLGCMSKGSAQESSEEQSHQVQPISGDTRIWIGTAGFRWHNYYVLTFDGVEKRSRTKLDVELRHLWFTSRYFGWGLQGMTQLYIVDFFGNVVLGNGALGPLLRVYPWQNDHWQFHLQGGGMIGYDLALSDALDANRSEGVRYRFGLRSGLTYRVSDNFGVYLELGPDWEADDQFEFDSRAFQLDIGIQLFRF